MANDEKLPVIYRFPNATLVQKIYPGSGNKVAFLDGGKPAAKSKLFSDDFKELVKKLGYKLFAAVAEDAVLEQSKFSQELVSYIPKDESSGGLRELTADDYEKLSPAFKAFYESKLAEPVETKSILEHELRTVDYELNEDVLLGKDYLTELHRHIDGIRKQEAARRRSYYSSSSSEPKLELWRNLPLNLSDDEVFKVVGLLGNRITNTSGGGYGATLSLHEYSHIPSYITVTFFVSTYSGEMRKQLDTKKDGHPYADRRGRMVKDYPKTAGSATLTPGDLALWWGSIGGNSLADAEKFEALNALTRSILKVS